MKHLIYLLFLSLIVLPVDAQSLSELQAQRKKTEENIALTNKLLNQNSKNKNQELSNIKLLSRKIAYREKLITDIDKETSALSANIELKSDVINSYEQDLEKMKTSYAELLQYMWTRRSTYDQIMYVLSGQDVTQIYRRLRYIQEFAEHQKAQATAIQELSHRLTIEKDSLTQQKNHKVELQNKYNSETIKLQGEQSSKQKQVASLSKKEKELKKQLDAQQKKRNELKKVVDKLIAEAAKKATKTEGGKLNLTPEQKLTSSQFAGNYGKLPWPVASGIIIEKFGKHKHEQLSRVEVENDGIDIRTDNGSNARAVFDGEVTTVAALPGYNKGVIIRHGEYYSFYANLSEVYVKKGDFVNTKQNIGKIYTDTHGKTLIHFRIYKEMTKLNPENWLSK